MYNVNVKNTYGVGGQAIALSQYGSRVGIYACGLYGYQDTLLVNDGTQVYLRGYIEVSDGQVLNIFEPRFSFRALLISYLDNGGWLTLVEILLVSKVRAG
jgi:hypothetical protein